MWPLLCVWSVTKTLLGGMWLLFCFRRSSFGQKKKQPVTNWEGPLYPKGKDSKLLFAYLLPSSESIPTASFWLDTKQTGAKHYACQNRTINARHEEESQWKWKASLVTFQPFMRTKSHAWGHRRAGLNSILQGLRVFLHAPLPLFLSQDFPPPFLFKQNNKSLLWWNRGVLVS